ncbi:hypothetical protein AK812_SmicGene9990 [Symbiodinium microadriaticum]|uniref:Uncharacterized protein n=1 Tax=Symbiodinium microadriaticum TaxID=2951 RepID=A0A1Q9EGY6_SYMMI|nr:hypothetical protein AK812_SmicGene9990 [Symbiodinium microadriaticum]
MASLPQAQIQANVESSARKILSLDACTHGQQDSTFAQDRTYVRGAAGVTVRQLESLVRPEHVREAFELQVGFIREGESIEFDEIAAGAEGEQEAGVSGEASYIRGQMLLRQLAEQDAAGVMVKESDLVTW